MGGEGVENYKFLGVKISSKDVMYNKGNIANVL